MDALIYNLSPEENDFVKKFIKKQDDPGFAIQLWLEGFRCLFNINEFTPIQYIYFYVLDDNKISQYKLACTVVNLTFNDFKNMIKDATTHHITGTIIGPRVSNDSCVTDMVKIINIFEHTDQISKFI